jgi:hypothetical protein
MLNDEGKWWTFLVRNLFQLPMSRFHTPCHHTWNFSFQLRGLSLIYSSRGCSFILNCLLILTYSANLHRESYYNDFEILASQTQEWRIWGMLSNGLEFHNIFNVSLPFLGLSYSSSLPNEAFRPLQHIRPASVIFTAAAIVCDVKRKHSLQCYVIGFYRMNVTFLFSKALDIFLTISVLLSSPCTCLR